MLDDIDDAIEVSDEEAREISEAARHEQLQGAIQMLTDAIKESNVNDVVGEAMQNQTVALAKFSEAIKQVSSSKTDDTLINSVSLMSKEIIEGQKEINQNLERLITEQSNPREWVFSFQRGYGNITESITAKQIK